MVNKIKIDIVSDIVCPWCLIGYSRLEQAISEMKIRDEVDIEWHPFELNPDMPAEGEGAQAYRARKYGATSEDTKAVQAGLTKLGAELGFTFNFFDRMKLVNTRDAHILLEYAKRFGLQTQLNIRLAKAFYGEKKDISNRKTLVKELESVGLNANEALAELNDNDARDLIQKQESHWQNLGITGVPTMIFNNLNVISGAQSVDTYKQALSKSLNYKKRINEKIS